jgi:hypothetical protein
MKLLPRLIIVSLLIASPLLLCSCSTPGVQDTRSTGLERRQDRMDSRTEARQERWKERGEREDARAEARFNSW